MCTAATYLTRDFYFGRTLDYEFSYGEEVVIVPRNFILHFREMDKIEKHYAMVGMAHMEEKTPLFYEAVNEKGLGMAGLNFVGNAAYQKSMEGKENVATFEFIPWVLGQCATVKEARGLVEKVNLTDTPFSRELPVAQLHWIIAGRDGCIIVESVEEGIKVYDNPVGVLANNPAFPEQMFQLNNYMHLSPKEPRNHFSDKLELQRYSRGMGALGLPGDLSSASRFVRAAFVRMNAVSGDSEEESVSQFFHILGSVEQQRGCCEVGDGKYEITIYTSCCNVDQGIYYYTTYGNHQITAVDMHKEELDGSILVQYPLVREQQIYYQNGK
ncbi:linear amide C-N hydrolase [bacterium D16-51]|nr:linear amide C-N hydrolase [bacterium D16-59]RKI61507.1 linear amide C-N hydrolase [bacterium D16-51]